MAMSEFYSADRILLTGEATAPLLKLGKPISFWGGVDPKTGRITDPRHPQYNELVCGKILAMERCIGSSSGSSVILELFTNGLGPAGLILVENDAILTLGSIVAREMGCPAIPIFLVSKTTFGSLPSNIHMKTDGQIEQAQL